MEIFIPLLMSAMFIDSPSYFVCIYVNSWFLPATSVRFSLPNESCLTSMWVLSERLRREKGVNENLCSCAFSRHSKIVRCQSRLLTISLLVAICSEEYLFITLSSTRSEIMVKVA